MTGKERRQQLLDVARELFAEKGSTVPHREIAHRAGVSKPVVYEHFGGKEGIYAVVVDRRCSTCSTPSSPPSGPATAIPVNCLKKLPSFARLHRGLSDGFRIMVRDSPVASASAPSPVSSTTSPRSRAHPGLHFDARGYDTQVWPVCTQALVGMVALTGQWWLEVRKPKKTRSPPTREPGWNGLSHLEGKPKLRLADPVACRKDALPRSTRVRRPSLHQVQRPSDGLVGMSRTTPSASAAPW